MMIITTAVSSAVWTKIGPMLRQVSSRWMTMPTKAA